MYSNNLSDRLWGVDELMYLSDRLLGNASFLPRSFSPYLTPHQPLPYILYFSYTHLVSIAQHTSVPLTELDALSEKLLHCLILASSHDQLKSYVLSCVPQMRKRLPCTYLYFQSNVYIYTVNTSYITVINSLWASWEWGPCFISFCIISPIYISWHVLNSIQSNWTYKGMKILLREAIHHGPWVSLHILTG